MRARTIVQGGLAVAAILAVAIPAAQARECAPLAATLISAQGEVEVRSDADWQPLRQGEILCDRDAIRTGRNSRAAIQLADDAVLRLDQNTTLVLSDVAPEPEEPSLLQLVFGAFQSFSRRPQTLQVDTPYINATIEGTEFALRVTATESALSVIEGSVRASNAHGAVSVAGGNGAVASAGSAPRSFVMVRPSDAVAWGFYYPPVLSLADAGGSPALAEAMRDAAANRPDAAIARLAAEPNATARERLYQAALLMSVGRTDEAGGLLDAILAADPANGNALAQSAVIDIVRNDRAAAIGKAERAVAAAPGEAAPYVALSLAQQADFRLEAARDTLLTAADRVPQSALVWSRLSEIWLTLGYRNRSGDAAERALGLDPDLERAHVMKGFAALTEYRTGAAREAFARAAELDPADPMPHLGLGLALIREGELETGRGEIDVAVALDSNRSLLRSYLGKAYFEENRNPLAVQQFEIARELDPQDPTPWLYDAIRLQTENRPGEALAAIQESIARNDNRAVYRGRLQLDQDQAARGASLGRIYDDLGFVQLGLRESARSQDLDPSNAAAHRFMADVYRGERRRELARVSELTRAQLLQDINLSPLQPSMTETNLNLVSAGGPANAGFNEFNSLFASDGVRFTGSGTIGNDQTFGGEAALALQADNFSVSFGGFEFQTDGFRKNFDADHSIYDLFAQWAVTPEFNVQAEVRHRETELGDLGLDFDPDIFQQNLRLGIEETSARFGARFSPDPHNDTLFSFVYNERETFESNIFGPFPPESGFPQFFSGTQTLDGDGWQAELQHIYQRGDLSVTVGASYIDFSADVRERFALLNGFVLADSLTPGATFENLRLYAYGSYELPIPESLGDLTLTLGLSYDDYKQDERAASGSGAILDFDEFNPKAGLQWDVTDDLTFRAAYVEVVKPPLVTNRTIEPTQVAGFNQYFDDFNGAPSERIGFGVDYRLTDTIFFGGEATWRKFETPYLIGPVGNKVFQSTDWKEQLHRAYIYALPHPRVPVSVEFIYDRFQADLSPFTLGTNVPSDLETFSVPVTVRYFDPSGFFAGVRGTYVHQDVERDTGAFAQGTSDFVNVDAVLGYRLPNQRGSLTLEVQNLFDNHFRYQDDGFREVSNVGATGPFFPELGVLGRVTINF